MSEAEGEERNRSSGKPLKVMAFDEARFGLINWHTWRRYCPMGFRPPWVVRRAYKWTYLYAAVDPATGESSCLYLPGMDRLCLEAFLGHLGEAYSDHHLVIVLDGAHVSVLHHGMDARYVHRSGPALSRMKLSSARMNYW